MHDKDALSNAVAKMLRHITVYDCSDKTMVRVGNANDGGYVVLQELCEKAPMLYTFGVGDDVSFELDFVRRWSTTRVKLNDPTIEKLPVEHVNFDFRRRSLGRGYVGFGGAPWDAMLKVDVEWDEWEALLYLSMKDLHKFSQILIELHFAHAEPRAGLTGYFQSLYQRAMNESNRGLFVMYEEALRKLTEYHFIYHAHANNSLPVINVGGHQLPPLLELSLVRRDLAKRGVRYAGSLPRLELDAPNKTDCEDIDLAGIMKTWGN